MSIPFDLALSESQRPIPFESQHWMAYRLRDDRVLIDLTGIILLGLKGSSNWVRKTLKAGIYGGKASPLLSLGPTRQEHHWEVRPEMWSVSAAPASMFNGNTAVNAGWAVDTCNTEWDLGNPASSGDLLGYIDLYLNLAVRDSDGIMYRISYDFRAVGHLVQVRDNIVE